MTVTAAALWSPDRLWILVRWPDKTRDDVHRPWVWSKGEKAYVAGREVEDALSLSFAREGRMGECMLSGEEAATDLWTWRAGRTDPSGFAEDATMTLSFQRIRAPTRTRPATGGPSGSRRSRTPAPSPTRRRSSAPTPATGFPATSRAPPPAAWRSHSQGLLAGGVLDGGVLAPARDRDPVDAVFAPGREIFSPSRCSTAARGSTTAPRRSSRSSSSSRAGGGGNDRWGSLPESRPASRSSAGSSCSSPRWSRST